MSPKRRSKRNTASSKTEIERRKLQVAKKIVEVLDEYERTWQVFSEKQDVLHELYRQQILVSNTFTQYNLTWRAHNSRIRSNMSLFLYIHEIDDEVQILSRVLDEFEVKTCEAGRIYKEFLGKMKTAIRTLKESLNKVSDAKTLADLEAIEAPATEWLQHVADPEEDRLTEEWQQLDLEPKISGYLEQLRFLLNNYEN